jgi:hypothetical protein
VAIVGQERVVTAGPRAQAPAAQSEAAIETFAARTTKT